MKIWLVILFWYQKLDLRNDIFFCIFIIQRLFFCFITFRINIIFVNGWHFFSELNKEVNSAHITALLQVIMPRHICRNIINLEEFALSLTQLRNFIAISQVDTSQWKRLFVSIEYFFCINKLLVKNEITVRSSWKYLILLLKKCKEHQVHTYIQSSRYYSYLNIIWIIITFRS